MALGEGAISQERMRRDQARRAAQRRDPRASSAGWEPDAQVGPFLGEPPSEDALEQILREETHADLRWATAGTIGSGISTVLLILCALDPGLQPVLLPGLPLTLLLASWSAKTGQRVATRAGDEPELLWQQRLGRTLARGGSALSALLLIGIGIGPLVWLGLALEEGLHLGTPGTRQHLWPLW